MEQGPVEKSIIEQCYRNNLPLPEKIANAPEITPGLSFFLAAFFELSTCRYKGGMGDGPIPWVAINEYCKYYGIRGEQREDLEYHVQKLDIEFLKVQAKRAEKPPPKPRKR